MSVRQATVVGRGRWPSLARDAVVGLTGHHASTVTTVTRQVHSIHQPEATR